MCYDVWNEFFWCIGWIFLILYMICIFIKEKKNNNYKSSDVSLLLCDTWVAVKAHGSLVRNIAILL